ncbi:hypothetical protein U1Q18_003036 [Sarracenia purpurea var. burkii]
MSDLPDGVSSSSEPESRSKNAAKRELKNKKREEDRRRKEEGKANQVQKPQTADDEDMDPTLNLSHYPLVH